MAIRSLVLHHTPEVRESLLAALGRRGHRVVGADDPEAVLPAHAQSPFALVVMGWGVGSFRGPELLRALLDGAPPSQRPLVLVARHPRDRATEEAMLDAGASDVLAWPMTAARLARRLLVAERWLREGERRRLAEQALRRAAGSFRSLLDRLPEGIAVHRDERFAYVNQALAKLLGHDDPAELLGRSLLEWSVDPVGLRQRLDHATRHRQSPAREVVLRGPDDARLVVEIGHIAVDFEGVPSTLSYVRDLRAQRELEAGLRQADRMASVGTLALGVAHELNNPLAYVLSNLQLVRELVAEHRHALPDQLARSLESLASEAREGAARMRDVMKDLRTFSRIDAEPTSAMSIEPVLRACVQMTRNEIVHRATLELDLGDTPAVLGNEARLAQVFLALLVHAAQSLPDDDTRKNRVRVSSYTDPGGSAVIEIDDNGRGLDAEQAARVFDPFYAARPRREGTGFGLSVAQNVVTTMEGTIDVESAPAGGTCFRITLPPAAASARARRRSSAAVLHAVRGAPRGRVLVVDDDPLVAKTIRRVLKGHEVTVVLGGKKALELLAGDGGFDLVLCDLMMPDLSGMDVFERAAARDAAWRDRFVFMTGGAFTKRAQRFLDEVPNERIDKPFDANALRRLVAAHLLEGPAHLAALRAAGQASGGGSP